MGVVSGMATAISGLEAASTQLGVISDNIVNSNTTGFKSARAEFQSILGQDLAGASSNDMGRGTMVAGITTLFTQGNIIRTERGTDVAVSGNGFFVLKSDSKGMTFTRDGSFRFDKDGWLTSMNGGKVQAYQATLDGRVSGKLGDVRIPFNTIAAKPSNKVDVRLNLDARMPIIPSLDLTRPEETSSYTTSLQIFDSVGNSHAIGLYFNRVSDSEWEWTAMTDGANLAGGKAGNPEAVSKGTVTFDAEGRLVASTQSIVNSSFSNGAIPDQKLYFDFGKTVAEGGQNNEATTQFGSKSAVFLNVQDGWAAGALSDTSVDSDGIITGIYTNGQNRILGQLALARFEATERLAKVGENQFRETVNSGQAAIGKPSSNGRGGIMTKSLETSNVDIAKEFVEMIKAERAFQASAKSITTANSMMDEVMNIKRG